MTSFARTTILLLIIAAAFSQAAPAGKDIGTVIDTTDSQRVTVDTPDSSGDSVTLGPSDSGTVEPDSPPMESMAPAPVKTVRIGDTLGGNLPKQIDARAGPYLVTSDIYVPSGKTVIIKPGVVILFRNFTELHVEGRLIAEGTSERPIVFTSEFDRTWNPGSALLANPYDWNGISIHESGIGSSLAFCRIQYTVYGVNSLTRYIKINQVIFRNNGRSDLMIEGKNRPVSTESYFYALTISDAKKDGVPVAILMDPMAKKRDAFRYGGFSLGAGGLTIGALGLILLSGDQKKLDALSDKTVADDLPNPTVSKVNNDWEKAHGRRDRDRWMAGISFSLAIIGGAGFGWSFTF
jgi:hypothetical protein